MKKNIFYFAPFFIFLLLGFFLWRGLSLNPASVPSTFIHKPAPDFALPDLYHPTHEVNEEILRGKISVVHVWASWCEVCVSEHAALFYLVRIPGVQMIGWNYKDELSAAKRYLAQQGNPYHRVLWDKTGVFAINWGVYGTPETFVVDKTGVIRYKHIGALNEVGVQEKLLQVIHQIQKGAS